MKWLLGCLALVSACAWGGGPQLVLWEGERLPAARLHPLSLAGARLQSRQVGGGKKAYVLRFAQERPYRSFVGLELKAPSAGRLFRSLSTDAFLKCDSGIACHWAVLLEECGGGLWVRLCGRLEPGENVDLRCGLDEGQVRELSFAPDDNGRLDWDKVTCLAVGVLVDGMGKGEVTFNRLVLEDASHSSSAP